MSKYTSLTRNIKKSNLSKVDKETLLAILNSKDHKDDFDDFIQKVISIYGISETILKLFGIGT
uniref:hypothetical protein n=1 Tax=Flavobacterium sp. TaxID=239 RepID=UPI00404AC276